MSTLEKARNFMYRNARPIDLARWQYHFEGGSKENVLDVLSRYQNEDGGFAHALEADLWNPNSSPISTWNATEKLREINFTDNTHPIIKGILSYLASGKNFDGKLWHNVILSNNDYPHAPWWHAVIDKADSYNPTVCLAGFIIRFADKNSDLYKLGCRIAKEAFFANDKIGLSNDMHIVNVYIRLLEYCTEAQETEIIDLTKLEKRLQKIMPCSITQNFAEWRTSYSCKPSLFFNNKDSVFYVNNKKIADYECEFINETQQADGSWDIPWCWSAYPNEWAIAENWWKGHTIIMNMLYLKGMGIL